jgi:hypothetical protein
MKRVASDERCAGHNVFVCEELGVTFNSNFDNGNLALVERATSGKDVREYDFRIWSAPDNMDTEIQSKTGFWYYFVVTGLPAGVYIRINLVNASNHGGLYRYDMVRYYAVVSYTILRIYVVYFQRPVYKGNCTNQKWARLRNSVRFFKDGNEQQLCFEHHVDQAEDKISFAFTYPYTYSMVCSDCDAIDAHVNNFAEAGSLFAQRELLTTSCDNRRVELLTISSVDGADQLQREALIPTLFPEAAADSRPPTFPEKEIIFVSARVHPGITVTAFFY